MRYFLAMRLMSLCEEHHVQTAPGPTRAMAQANININNITNNRSISINNIVSNKSSNRNTRQFTVSTAYEQMQRSGAATIRRHWRFMKQ